MKYANGLEVYGDIADDGFTVSVKGLRGRGIEIPGIFGGTDILMCIPTGTREDFEVEDEN